MLKVKSAVLGLDCLASSVTATFSTVGEDETTSAPGICTDLPLIESQTFAASSDEPNWKTISLSSVASVARSDVPVIELWIFSAGVRPGLIEANRPVGGF